MPDDSPPRYLNRSPFLGIDEPSLADVSTRLDLIESLSATRRRDIRSAILRLAGWAGRDPAMVSAHARDIARIFKRLNLAEIGISKKTLSNVKSEVAFALRVTGANTSCYQKLVRFSDAWTDLNNRLGSPRLERGLSRLMRYCSAPVVGIEPYQVDDEVLDSFRHAIEVGTFVDDVDQLVRTTARCWNEAAKTVPGWPQKSLTVAPTSRQPEHLSPDQLPGGFVADLEAHLEWVGGKNRFGPNRPPRVLNKSTVNKRRRMLLAAASTAIRNGIAENNLQSVADLVRFDVVEKILLAYYAKNDDRITSYMRCLATELISIAWHWAGVNERHLADLKDIRRELGTAPSGLTEKNKRMLRQFEDPENLWRYLSAPDRVMAKARKKKRTAPNTAAILAQIAVAIAILSVAPMRIENLASLRLDRHFTWRTRKAGEWIVSLDDHETKNDQSHGYPLPAAVTRIVEEYLKDFRPYLVDDDNPWLFPGTNGGHKDKTWLSQQISDVMLTATGIRMTAHQFRHVAAKLHLDRHPGDFATVQKLLGHKSIITTMRFYAEFSTRQAGEYFAQTILGLKEDLQARPPRHHS